MALKIPKKAAESEGEDYFLFHESACCRRCLIEYWTDVPFYAAEHKVLATKKPHTRGAADAWASRCLSAGELVRLVNEAGKDGPRALEKARGVVRAPLAVASSDIYKAVDQAQTLLRLALDKTTKATDGIYAAKKKFDGAHSVAADFPTGDLETRFLAVDLTDLCTNIQRTADAALEWLRRADEENKTAPSKGRVGTALLKRLRDTAPESLATATGAAYLEIAIRAAAPAKTAAEFDTRVKKWGERLRIV